MVRVHPNTLVDCPGSSVISWAGAPAGASAIEQTMASTYRMLSTPSGYSATLIQRLSFHFMPVM